MAELPGTPALAKLIEDYLGEPSTLRWLSVHPDGRVVERTSDNNIAWSVVYEMWVQWRLVRDVYRAVDPTNRGFGLTGVVLIPTEQGVAITARLDEARINRVATEMLAALGVKHEVRGTAAWLGERQPETGLHADLDDDERAAVVELAVRCGATPGGAS